MIVCKLELWPGGDAENAEHLGTIAISNNVIETIRTSGKRGDYRATIMKKRNKVWRYVTVKNFPRQSYHPWNLIREILNKAAEQNGGQL